MKKRIFDFSLSISAFFLLSFFMLIIALLVRFKIGSPVLFRQMRPGFHGRPFFIYKFRTMTDARDEDGNLLPDSERLTRLGKFLRKTSMDELLNEVKPGVTGWRRSMGGAKLVCDSIFEVIIYCYCHKGGA